MASWMHLVVDNYNELIEYKKDPVVDSWPLMSGPSPVLLILGAYLYFVLKLGPKWMANRRPFELKNVLIGYNLYQVLFSLWLSSRAFKFSSQLKFILSHSCTEVSSEPNAIRLVVTDSAWWYFFSKVSELLDTVFFVLRKKQSQVTFLHVYHHSIMVLFTWAYLKFFPGEQGVLLALLNTLVHVFMYFYYFLAALGPEYQKYLWWKKYMTWIQLAQFCIMLVYLFTIIAMDCKLPKALTFIFIGNSVTFLYLFVRFYIRAYRKPKNQKHSPHPTGNVGIRMNIAAQDYSEEKNCTMDTELRKRHANGRVNMNNNSLDNFVNVSDANTETIEESSRNTKQSNAS